MTMLEPEKAKFEVKFDLCCFCGKLIEETDVDPCTVRVATVQDQWQVWFCHSACFRERIFKDDKIDLSPAHF